MSNTVLHLKVYQGEKCKFHDMGTFKAREGKTDNAYIGGKAQFSQKQPVRVVLVNGETILDELTAFSTREGKTANAHLGGKVILGDKRYQVGVNVTVIKGQDGEYVKCQIGANVTEIKGQ